MEDQQRPEYNQKANFYPCWGPICELFPIVHSSDRSWWWPTSSFSAVVLAFRLVQQGVPSNDSDTVAIARKCRRSSDETARAAPFATTPFAIDQETLRDCRDICEKLSNSSRCSSLPHPLPSHDVRAATRQAIFFVFVCAKNTQKEVKVRMGFFFSAQLGKMVKKPFVKKK